jgi:hypothetical protein
LLLALLASSCSCSSFWRRTKYKRREKIPWLVADTILYHPLSRPSHVDSPPPSFPSVHPTEGSILVYSTPPISLLISFLSSVSTLYTCGS